MSNSNSEKSIYVEISVPASPKEVWNAWTTEEGIKSFFAPECNIELKVGGAYELLFDLEAESGSQGSEGMIIMAFQPKEMLSFTWNAPPSYPNIRGQMTHVVLRLSEEGEKSTKLRLSHDGWGSGEEWDQVYHYFDVAWKEVVLKRLIYMFETGPVDWDDLPFSIV